MNQSLRSPLRGNSYAIRLIFKMSIYTTLVLGITDPVSAGSTNDDNTLGVSVENYGNQISGPWVSQNQSYVCISGNGDMDIWNVTKNEINFRLSGKCQVPSTLRPDKQSIVQDYSICEENAFMCNKEDNLAIKLYSRALSYNPKYSPSFNGFFIALLPDGRRIDFFLLQRLNSEVPYDCSKKCLYSNSRKINLPRRYAAVDSALVMRGPSGTTILYSDGEKGKQNPFMIKIDRNIVSIFAYRDIVNIGNGIYVASVGVVKSANAESELKGEPSYTTLQSELLTQ